MGCPSSLAAQARREGAGDGSKSEIGACRLSVRRIKAAGLVIGHLEKDRESAIRSVERAPAINASSATAHYAAAHVYSFSDYEAATAHADRALRLSPFDPLA